MRDRRPRRTRDPRPACWLTLLSSLIGLLAACSLHHPTDRQTSGAVTPRPPAGASAAPVAGPAGDGRHPLAGTGPVRSGLPGREPVFPPPPPDGIVGIAVPSILIEPPAAYRTQGRVDSDRVFLSEIPTPKRGGRQMGEPPASRPGPPPATELPALGGGAPQPRAPAAGVVFDSLDFDDNRANTNFLFIPPDPIGAAGPQHLVSVTNVSIQFHTKDGTPLLDSVAGGAVTGVSLASFFAPLAPVNLTFDPKVIYDQHAARFVVVTLERQDVLLGDPADTSRILVAVSDDDDPNGTWHLTAIDSAVSISSVDHWADYPGLAVDEEAVYITANMFSFFSSGASYGGGRLWVIDKFSGAGGGLYAGGTATVNLFNPYSGAGLATTTQPAHILGAAPGTPNVGTFLVSYSGLSNGVSEFVQIVRLDDPIGPGISTFTQQFLNIGDIEDFSPSALPDAPQAGIAELLETNDRRALHSVWRDDSLWMTATIDPISGDDAGQATAHWWELDTSSLGSLSLVQQGDVGGEDIATGAHTFFPSIAVNDSGDAAIGFAVSAETIFASSAYTTRRLADAAGTNTGSTVLRAGLDYYIRTFDAPPCSTTPARNRWGDYSGMAVDPFDQCFWVFNQHAQARGTGTVGGCAGRPNTEDGRWGTSFGYFCESCATRLELESLSVSAGESHQARDSLSASTVEVESAGVLSLTSGQVELSDGFTVRDGGRATILNGPCS